MGVENGVGTVLDLNTDGIKEVQVYLINSFILLGLAFSLYSYYRVEMRRWGGVEEC